MENLIFSRVVLLIFMIVNLFIAYGANSLWNPISKKLVNGFYGFEAVLLVSFIVYDNITTPLNDTLFVVILGYIFVCLPLVLGYFSYLPWTIISPKKEYAAVVDNEYIVISNQYFICCHFYDNYGKLSKAHIPIEQIFNEPENKEKDMTGLYKEWSIDGKLKHSYMKYKCGDSIKIRYNQYITRHKYLIVDVI